MNTNAQDMLNMLKDKVWKTTDGTRVLMLINNEIDEMFACFGNPRPKLGLFDEAFELVLGHEGGFQDDPRDRGNWTSGRVGVGMCKGTKFGISAASYPMLDIKNLTLDDAKDIYRQDYWDMAGCNHLPRGVGYMIFDMAVNHGVHRAVRWLQAQIGTRADGVFGPNTISAVGGIDDDWPDILEFLYAGRDYFYRTLPDFEHYGDGWIKRNDEVHKRAQEMLSA